MVFLPYTNLFIGPTHTITAAGSHILVLENLCVIPLLCSSMLIFPARKGDVVSRHSLEENVDLMKSGPVRCVDVDWAGRLIVAVGEDKVLRLWEMDKQGVLKVVNRR